MCNFFQPLLSVWPEWSEHDSAIVSLEFRVLDRFLRLVLEVRQVTNEMLHYQVKNEQMDCIAYYEITGHCLNRSSKGGPKAGYFDTSVFLELQTCEIVKIDVESLGSNEIGLVLEHYSAARYELRLANPSVDFCFVKVNPRYAFRFDQNCPEGRQEKYDVHFQFSEY